MKYISTRIYIYAYLYGIIGDTSVLTSVGLVGLCVCV